VNLNADIFKNVLTLG